MNYLLDLDFTTEEVEAFKNSPDENVVEKLELFPLIVKKNYEILKGVGISNYKEIFINHTHMFFLNPDRFKAIFDKYDHNDLIRCLEKNGAVIEKL